MRPATRACRSFGLAHAIISRRLQSFVNSKNWAVPAIQILASGVPLTEHLNFEMFSIFKLGQADPIDIPARRSSHAGAPCAGRDRPAHDSQQNPDSPVAFLDSCRWWGLRVSLKLELKSRSLAQTDQYEFCMAARHGFRPEARQ